MALVPFIKITKIRSCILVISIYLSIEFGYIYLKRYRGSYIRNLIKVSMSAKMAPISIGYIILVTAKFLLLRIYIFIRLEIMTQKISNFTNL